LWLNRFTYFCTALTCGVIAWYSAHLVYTDYQYGSRAFLALPLWLCEIIIPLAFTTISLRFAAATILGSAADYNRLVANT
jgi:TRAP-type C4-dicarboxylate transport system permease small subunit